MTESNSLVSCVLLDMYEEISRHPTMRFESMRIKMAELYDEGPELDLVTESRFFHVVEFYNILGAAPEIINSNNINYLMIADPRVIAANLAARIVNEHPVFVMDAKEVEARVDKQLYLLGMLIDRRLLPDGEYLRNMSRHVSNIMGSPLPDNPNFYKPLNGNYNK